jgi:hypothetical protein
MVSLATLYHLAKAELHQDKLDRHPVKMDPRQGKVGFRPVTGFLRSRSKPLIFLYSLAFV